jgi:hypothetical protein
MKSISTSLDLLFGFAVFIVVNVVATPEPTGSTPDPETEGCPTTPVI